MPGRVVVRVGVGMVALRTGCWTLAAAAALLLPACAATPRAAKPADAPPPVSVAVASATGFAELPSVPGQRVARHPAVEAPATTPAAVAKPPETLPPTKVEVAVPPPDAPLVAAVRAYLDNRPEVAADQLKSLDRPNQDLMAQLLPPVVALSRLNLARAGPVDYGVLAAQLETPLKSLAAKATLGIPKAVFCSTPTGFGQYRPLPDGHVYRRGTLAEVYVEVRNAPSLFVRHPEFGDGYLTQLNAALRLRDAAGNVVELTDEGRRPVPVLQSVQKDFSRSPVRDYSKAFRFAVPQKPGRYTLTVEFLDPETGRAVSQSLSFEVGGS